jgi:integrase
MEEEQQPTLKIKRGRPITKIQVIKENINNEISYNPEIYNIDIYKMSLEENVLKRKPDLCASSVKTYVSTLKGIYTKVFKTTHYTIKDYYDKSDEIIEFIKDIAPSKRKSILSSLVVLTSLDVYRKQMLSDISAHNEIQGKQTKTEKQIDNEVSVEDIKHIYSNLRREAKTIYKKKMDKTDKDFQKLQDFILLSLFNGEFMAPRRSLDLTEFKLFNTNTKCNYMEGNKLVFNIYKNSNTKGQQTIEIPDELVQILTKYRSNTTNEYLFTDLNGNKLNSTKLTQKFNKIFNGKHFSVNGLRHSYMSSRYGDLIDKKKEMEKDFEAMGSSLEQQNVYIQK